MADYRIFETKTFQQDLARASVSGLGRLKLKLQTHVYPLLRKEPHFGTNIKKLQGWTPPTWRYRIGSWRFFYEIEEKQRIVYMIAAEPRGSAYR